MSDDTLKNDFLAEVDDYYDAVMEGIKLMESNQVLAGVEMIFRPMHSIKGTAGFIGGLEVISKFAHKVETYLDGVRKNTIPPSPQIIGLLIQSIEGVFALLDQAQKDEHIDDTEGRKILIGIEEALNPGTTPMVQKEEILLERRNGVCVFRIHIRRIHVERQYRLLIDAFRNLQNNEMAALDMSRVQSIGSTAWGKIWMTAQDREVGMIGMNQACRDVFFRWKFDQHVSLFTIEEEFWKKRKEGK